MPPEMFLRTAQTEARIDKLEEQMARVLKHLKLEDDECQSSEPTNAPSATIEQKSLLPPTSGTSQPLPAKRATRGK